MRVRTNILISFLIAVISIIGFFNIPPGLLKYLNFSNYFNKNLGTTVTTISTATNLANFPAIYNADIPALNNGKIENSSSSVAAITTLSNLVTVGALSSGSLTTGFTTINVAQGGTGSTTLSSNRVLLGNGTSGIITVSGWGNSGQFLTSNGASTAPTWQTSALALGDNYAWTGTHNFTGTTLIKNLNASSTAANPMIWNGLSLNTPSTHGASSTALWTDGSGKLIWDNPSIYQCGEQVLTGANATTTVTVAARKDLRIIFDSPGASGNANPTMTFNTDYAGGGTNYGRHTFTNYANTGDQNGVANIEITGVSTSTAQSFETNIINTATIQKRVTSIGTTGGLNRGIFTSMGTWNNTTDQVTTVNVHTGTAGLTWNTGTRLTVMCSRD